MNKTNSILKWTATAILIIGTAVNGLGMYPEGPALLVLGGFIWLIVAVRIKDAPLIVTNLVMATVGLAAILYTLNKEPEFEVHQSGIDRQIECERLLGIDETK
jgi:hypothetical protein